MKLEGKVTTGKGTAKKFLSLKPYKDRIEEKTGFRPFPGTLNLKVNTHKLEKFKENRGGKSIDGFEYEGRDYGGLKLYTAKIEDLEAAVLDIDRSDHEENIVEVISPVKLRDELGLEDGQRLQIHD